MTELQTFSHSKNKLKDITTQEKINKENKTSLCEPNKQIIIESFPSNIINAPIIPKRKVFIDPPILNLNQMVINMNNNNFSEENFLLENNKTNKIKSEYKTFYSLKGNTDFLNNSPFTGSSKCLTILSLLEKSMKFSNKRYKNQFIN